MINFEICIGWKSRLVTPDAVALRVETVSFLYSDPPMHDVVWPVVVPAAGKTGKFDVVPPPLSAQKTPTTLPRQNLIVSHVSQMRVVDTSITTAIKLLGHNPRLIAGQESVWNLQHPSHELVMHSLTVREADCATSGLSKCWQVKNLQYSPPTGS